jgi:RNA polymerase sigma-70 factor (ECF subfamily)
LLAGDEDARLMLAFQNGDSSAFDALFRRWAARLLRYVSRMVCDAGTAEELVQDVFVRVFKARERYVADARFSTWLYTIATRVALNELRRPRRRRPHQSIDSATDAALAPASPGPRSDDVVHARRVAARVQDALAELPERQRAALYLVAVEGLSYAEVAGSLETTATSVKALVHRARCALVERMETGEER